MNLYWGPTVNFTTADARIAFARNCVRGAERFELCGQRRVAAELRGAAGRALDGFSAAVAPSGELDPSRSQTQAIAVGGAAGIALGAIPPRSVAPPR